MDQGGHGEGQLVGGFGGKPAVDRQVHRAVMQRVGKAAVVLVHGNFAEASTPPWDMLGLKRMLLAAGYPEELIWAPSYLGPGLLERPTPHVKNVNDLRDYIDSVCEYLYVDVVDVIAHSLGCSLTYAVCRGLEKKPGPVNWNHPKKWHRVGTLVALAGAFHGLGPSSEGEWITGGEFMNELLDEELGGGGETPYGAGKDQTPPPTPHNITYFCGIARCDFIDAQNVGTGRLAGAVNREYCLGTDVAGHREIKQNQVVFNDFFPYLNSVPPVPAAKMKVDKNTGSHPGPLHITVAVDQLDRTVDVTANRITKEFLAGFITDKVSETQRATLRNGQSITLATSGMWQLALRVDGATDDLTRTYWVGVPAVATTIETDNATPFEHHLLVLATASDPTARIYHSLDGTMWTESATATINQDAMVSFISITPAGLASELVYRSFTRAVPWDDVVTACANDHFLAGRIDVTAYLSYSNQFGFFTPFTLYHVDDNWIPVPDCTMFEMLPPALAALHDPSARADRSTREARIPSRQLPDGLPVIKVKKGDPEPGRHAGRVTVIIEASHDSDDQMIVYYSRDGSIPEEGSPSFVGRTPFDLVEDGNHLITCGAKAHEGTWFYQSFCYSIGQ